MKKILSGLVLATAALSIHAEEGPNTLKPSHKFPTNQEAIKAYNVDNPDQAILSPITVTVSASLLDELLSPKSVSIYSKEDIKKSGANTLLNFFKYNTSLQIDASAGNPLTPKISMRGFGLGDGFQAINIIVDGVSINSVDNVPQQLGSVPLQSIEKIEILNSSGSVLYGDNSAAGTIIIQTNNSFDREKFFGSLKAGGGTYANRIADARLGSVTEFHGVKLLADAQFSYSGSDGKKQVLDPNDANNTAFINGHRDTNEILNGKATWGFKVGDFEAISSYRRHESTTFFTTSLSDTEFNNNADMDGQKGSRQIVRDEDISTSLKYKINESFNLSYDFNKTDRERDPLTRTGWSAPLNYDGHSHRAVLQSIFDRVILKTGFDYKFNERTPSGNNQGVDVTTKENIAAFISGDFFITDRLTLNAGFRQAWIAFTRYDKEKSNTPNAYNAAINYSLFKKDALFFSYQHAYQSPNIDNFFSSTYDADWNVNGSTFNGFIESMTMNTYSTGYKHIDDNLKIKLELYYSNLKNEMYYDQTNNTNYDTSEKYGVELYFYKDFGFFDTNINYTYTDTRAKTATGVYEISGQPHHVVLASIGKQFTNTLLPLQHHGIRLSHKYKSKSYRFDDGDNIYNEAPGFNSSAINYQLSDNQHWTVDFSVNNLFEIPNGQWVRGFPANGVYATDYERTFSGSVYYTF
ncbi:MAG: TonB-dependent receptor [Methylococcales bacterium]|nr:TonB-dependent receptor [Methylococcales bacterium]